jgi:hypothetical protein
MSSGSTLNAVPFRSTIFYNAAGPVAAGSVFTVGANGTQNYTSNLTLNTLSASTMNIGSTVISLGQSTNATSNGTTNAFTWASTLGTLTAVKKVAMTASGQYQYAVQNSTSSYSLSKTADSGITWTTLTSGLPAGSPAYTSVSVANQYALVASNGNGVYLSNNANTAAPTFTSVTFSPYIYLPFENSATDVMGNSTVTPTGTPTYVTGQVGYAVNLANTAGGTATKYIRATWAGAPNFSMSCQFYLSSTGATQTIFSAYSGNFYVTTNTSNQLILYIPSGGAQVAAVTSSAISGSTWYSVMATFQTGGVCALYLNNVLVGSYQNVGGTTGFSTSNIGLGTYDTGTGQAVNGYIDDFRLFQSATLFSPSFTQTAMSSTGQFMLAAATGGGLFQSSTQEQQLASVLARLAAARIA